MATMKRYRVVAPKDWPADAPAFGINYPGGPKGGEKRAEAGDVVDDLPAKSVGWLLAQGYLEEVA